MLYAFNHVMAYQGCVCVCVCNSIIMHSWLVVPHSCHCQQWPRTRSAFPGHFSQLQTGSDGKQTVWPWTLQSGSEHGWETQHDQVGSSVWTSCSLALLDSTLLCGATHRSLLWKNEKKAGQLFEVPTAVHVCVHVWVCVGLSVCACVCRTVCVWVCV